MIKTFHIGPHKTGSTYLQRHIFPNIRGVQYIGNGDLARCWKRGVDFSAEGGWLWSSEAALGSPYPVTEPPHYERFLRFCETVGVTRLITVRRSYPSWVRAVWFQSLNEWGTVGFKEWYFRNEANLEAWRMLYSELHSLSFYYEFELLVIDQRKLREAPIGTADEIADFCGGVFEGHTEEKSVNESGYGKAYTSFYLALNRSIGRVRSIRSPLSALRLSPRAQMQRGMGRILRKLSKTEIEMPDSLSSKQWG